MHARMWQRLVCGSWFSLTMWVLATEFSSSTLIVSYLAWLLVWWVVIKRGLHSSDCLGANLGVVVFVDLFFVFETGSQYID